MASTAVSINSSTTTVKEPHQDPTHPLFLHHLDSPDLLLTSQLLDHTNYVTQSHAMRVALSVKNKLPLIDGTLITPLDKDPSSAAGSRANNVVISCLYNSVSKAIVTSILFASTAHEILEDLRTRFPCKNGLRIC